MLAGPVRMPRASWPYSPVACLSLFPGRELANSRPPSANPVLDPELANAVPWSRAGWGCSLVAR